MNRPKKNASRKGSVFFILSSQNYKKICFFAEIYAINGLKKEHFVNLLEFDFILLYNMLCIFIKK